MIYLRKLVKATPWIGRIAFFLSVFSPLTQHNDWLFYVLHILVLSLIVIFVVGLLFSFKQDTAIFHDLYWDVKGNIFLLFTGIVSIIVCLYTKNKSFIPVWIVFLITILCTLFSKKKEW